MLMKPPSIFDDVVSQDSENFTVHSKQQSLKGKLPRKENTIRIGGGIGEQRDRSNQRDNESVHSNTSKRSKDKKSKETTLARPKIAEQSSRDDDAHSVHSTGSRHSQKSAKKQSNIMQRPKIQQPASKPKQSYGNELSFKNAIGDPEESVIKRYKLEEDESPKPVKYTEQRSREGEKRNKKYAPFAELQHKQGSEEEIPIFRIEEPFRYNKPQVVGLARPDEKRYTAKEVDRREISESRQIVNTEQSRTVFDQSGMANTKSVRRPIFGRDELNNNSKVSNAIDQSNVSGIDGSSRRKSNSKLRQLFNNSREKNGMEQSNLENESKTQSFGELVSQSRAIKPTVGTNDRMVQLERKVVDPDNDNFGIDSIKSGLDLTVSNNQHLGDKDRDSLIFEFEPERRKGMTVTSKNKKLHASEQELIKIGDELTSAKPKHIKETTENLPQLKMANIQSKDLKHVDKLLKENQQFLRNSALLNLSESDKLKRNSGDDYLFKIEDEDLPENYILPKNTLNTPWNQNTRQQTLNIKKVERNEKVPGKVKQLSPKKVKQEVVQQKPQPKPKPKEEMRERGQVKKAKSNQFDVINKQPEYKSKPEYLSKPQIKEIKEDYIKSPGKIAKNFETSSLQADNKSEKSNKSAKKGKTVKQSAIPRGKAHKIQIKNQGPRGEESFYEQQVKLQVKQSKEEMSINDLSLYSKKPEVKQQKKPNVYRFSDDENEFSEKPKSRTDINFYDNEARSNKPPSSRPPLSGKSAKSRSTSKDKVPKQTTLKIGSTQPADKNPFKKTAQPAKKLTLMEKALMKHNESSEDDRSQESFSSREDFSQNSRRSSNSKGSKKSIKENSIKIDRKQNSLIKNKGLPPYQRKVSSNSSNHQEEEQNTRQRSIEQQKPMIVNQRSIVSKNCTFIDEKGRLVQKDLVIKGKDVYGQSRIEDSTAQAFERMKRTKQSHRSRSKSRQNKGDKRKSSRDEGQSSSYQNSSYCSSFYQNSTYGKNNGSKGNAYNNTGSIYTGNQPQALKQFLKPVEQVPLYNQSNNERRPKKEQADETPRTFNDMFGKKNQQQSYAQSNVSNITDSRSKRSLKRTQNSARKR